MKTQRISDDDARMLVEGLAPAARPDLASLAGGINDFRAAAFEALPRPSAELVSRLDLARASGVSKTADNAVNGGVKRMVSWLLGLGLAAKITLGATVAAAAVTGAGAAGVLPAGPQETFDTVVSLALTSEETDEFVEDAGDDLVTDEPAEEETTDDAEDTDEAEAEGEDAGEQGAFGRWVSERAQDPDKVGREFGKETSEAARNGHDIDGLDEDADDETGEDADETTDETTDGEDGTESLTSGGKKNSNHAGGNGKSNAGGNGNGKGR